MHRDLGFLESWGRTQRVASVLLRPEGDARTVFVAPARARGLIAHGAGRAYGDCALNAQGEVLLTSGLDGVLGFDAATGIVEVEPGVTFRALLAAFLPRGFLVPVSPGTGFATIGGAVANDVHGKNHEKAGSFTQYVVWLDLLTPDGVVRRIGPEAEPALFRATCGGLGLTGVILRAAVRLQRVASAGVAVTSRRLADLDAFLAAIDDAAGAAYTVGWIDGTARGRHLGRGILETAELAASAPAQAPGGSLAVPFDFPGFALNPLSIGAFNALYFRHAPAVARTRVMRIERFFYPLDALRGWNRIYGRRGFYQFQCVVPFAEGAQAVRALMEVIAASGRASFLTTLKRLGDGAGGAEGYLSFPRAGYTLALDFPNAAGIEALYARLVEMTLRFGGRVYLAKDALLSAAAFRDMYPRWPEFRAVLEAVDPAARMQSDMARRLELRAA